METEDTAPGSECVIVTARVDPRELAFLSGIIDAYDGIALLRTMDHRLGLIEFWVAPDFVEDFRVIAEDLSQQIDLQLRWPGKIPPPSTDRE